MDYKAISKAITDPENQPHQWNDQELAEFFVSAADEIERLREALIWIERHPVEESKQWEVAVKEMKRLARSALKNYRTK